MPEPTRTERHLAVIQSEHTPTHLVDGDGNFLAECVDAATAAWIAALFVFYDGSPKMTRAIERHHYDTGYRHGRADGLDQASDMVRASSPRGVSAEGARWCRDRIRAERDAWMRAPDA